MNTNKHKQNLQNKCSGYFGLKGQYILAQSNGLGSVIPSVFFALKGQDKGCFYVALSERFSVGNFKIPGRCPGLRYAAPSVRC